MLANDKRAELASGSCSHKQLIRLDWAMLRLT
jgi:hypothetical protein